MSSEHLAGALALLARRARRSADNWPKPIDHAAMVQNGCEPLAARVSPDYEFFYRLPKHVLLLGSVAAPAELSCVRVLSATASIVANLRFAQRWRLLRLGIGPVNATLTLAPDEELTVTVRKTLRTQIDETTMRSSESLVSDESAILDKDVMNVQRSTSRTQQWQADANGELNIADGMIKVGASGSLSGTMQGSASLAIEDISEASRKSAQRLQALHKVEVGRHEDSVVESSQQRRMRNPYRDRGLTLHFHELNKLFAVTTSLRDIRPALVLELADLDLGRAFVMSHGDFLEDALLDRTLMAELREALRTARTPVSSHHRDKARRYARLAFHVLFESANVFNLEGGAPEENDPWYSFTTNDGLEDALDAGLGSVFATLGAFLRIQENRYRTRTPLPTIGPAGPPAWPGLDGQGHEDELEMALALADAIHDEWKGLPPDKVKDVMGVGDFSEVMRRVPGFLAIVDGLIRPLLEPTNDEPSAVGGQQRAEDVIQRVVSHLSCHRLHYAKRFLETTWRRSGADAFGDVLVRTLRASPSLATTEVETLLQLFDLRGAFVDGVTLVVPAITSFDLADAERFVAELTGREVEPPADIGTYTLELVVPADGVHIEAVAGSCVLGGLPADPPTARASVKIDAETR